jgi:hypothetical protein
MFYETETKIRERRDAKTPLRSSAEMPTTVTSPVDMSHAVENFRRLRAEAALVKEKVSKAASG